ncbi:MAG: spore coat protein [Christensenellales bacterium]|jgi:spore coat protein CotF
MQDSKMEFTPQAVMTDVLTTQKHLTDTYNTFANECASPQLKNEFMAILNDEHQIQHDVFCDMQQRGWYQVEAAEQTKIDQAKQKSQGML